jgi:hypothetical protein
MNTINGYNSPLMDEILAQKKALGEFFEVELRDENK